MEKEVSSSMLVRQFGLVICTEIGGSNSILTLMGLYRSSQREWSMRLLGGSGRGCPNYLKMTISECTDTLVGVVGVGGGGGGWGRATREVMPTPGTMLVRKMHA